MKKIFLIILLIQANLLLFSQNSEKIDSLKKLLHISVDDTNKTKLLSEISRKYQLLNKDSTLFYAKKDVTGCSKFK